MVRQHAPSRCAGAPDTSYASGSATVTAYDSTNHLYAYTITGLTPGTKYYYQVAVGTQCAPAPFFAPPPAAATAVKFFAYGDTRTNGSAHNGLAGQVVSLFTTPTPPSRRSTCTSATGSAANSESAWAGEWYDTGYTNLRKQDASLADIGVRGNHEGSAIYWKRYFPQPFQPGGLYCSFDYGPMHVVMLDQYTAYNAGSTQYNWLKADLAASTKKWKFVVLHEPGWSAGGGHGNNTTVQNDLQPLFVQYGVAHRLRRAQPLLRPCHRGRHPAPDGGRRRRAALHPGVRLAQHRQDRQGLQLRRVQHQRQHADGEDRQQLRGDDR